MSRDNKDIKLLNRVMDYPKDLQELINIYYNTMIDELNRMLRSMSLVRNYDSQLFENVIISAGQTLKVPHRLKTTPAFRLIVRATGSSDITDGDFTESYIELTNNGGSAATLTFILFKE